MKTKSKPKVVLVDIQGGAIQQTSAPRGVKLIVRDFDNCPDCGGEFCKGGRVVPCPRAKPAAQDICPKCGVDGGHSAECETWKIRRARYKALAVK